MIIAIVSLITALSISSIAAYFSVVGLMAIFSAAAYKVAIMGAVIEVGKIVSVIWLHRHWGTGHHLVRATLCFMVALVMLITSMGVFGLLSKGHIESTAQATQATASIELIDKQINRTRTQLTQQEKIVGQLDAAVDKYIDNNYITRGLEQRRQQEGVRQQTNNRIQSLQEKIESLQEQKFKAESQQRSLEREIGPVKYVAALVYSDTSDDSIERAVRILIIILVVIFDPLAIMLLIASQISFNERKPKIDNSSSVVYDAPKMTPEEESIQRKKSRMGQQKEVM